ncbi:DUF4153 domain-containing protein [Tabrizicola sp. YIM 78059]|uniref:DUF4153 domain-containing protein n=1 Tax=Tabrizicola sp. YIM 78059 TaxID=2529861 RepID=UPI00145B2F34|nr:DUF4153 domain-containing protein [Tabrizicola sp. YIM 78059]
MTAQLMERWWLAAFGAAGGAAVWAVVDAAERGALGDRPALILLALLATFLAATLAMAGPIGLWRALPRALGHALVTAALVWLGGLRFDTGLPGSPISILAVVTVATLPVPFMIGAARNGWRDYPCLFLEAWSVVVRFAAALTFTGLVWLVIYLSDQVLQIVGIRAIADLLRHSVVPMVITGAVLGLGMAVVYQMAELLSPYLVLRLFRLLLPVVLAVILVFLLALPFRGLSGLVGGLSPALLLLALVGAGISLVSVAIDQTDAEATQSQLLLRATQATAMLLPFLSALAAWAVWLRVEQYGLTPDRLFVALVAGLGLAYGLAYAVAVLRGPGWMERIRQTNIRMALVVIGLAALWLTPLLNAEAISARNQLARYDSGRTAAKDLDIEALRSWGRPGAEVLAALAERAQAPGQEALADRLAGRAETGEANRASLATVLSGLMPVQPETATGTRDILLAAAQDYQLRDWKAQCERGQSSGRPGCLMAVADLLPNRPGEEAILILERGSDYLELQGLYLGDDGLLVSRSVLRSDGGYIPSEEIADLLEAWRMAPPPLTAAPINQLGTGEAGLLIMP